MNQSTLSNQALLAALIGKRRAERLYQGSFAALLSIEDEDCRNKLFVAQEFVRRLLNEELKKRTVFSSPSQIRDYLRLLFKGKEHEVFVVLYLDANHRLIEGKEMFSGTINKAQVYAREVVKYALKCNAAAIVIAHNHPSGVCEPSVDDIATTRKLKEALRLVEIRVLDHFVVAGNTCVSFVERGLMEE